MEKFDSVKAIVISSLKKGGSYVQCGEQMAYLRNHSLVPGTEILASVQQIKPDGFPILKLDSITYRVA